MELYAQWLKWPSEGTKRPWCTECTNWFPVDPGSWTLCSKKDLVMKIILSVTPVSLTALAATKKTVSSASAPISFPQVGTNPPLHSYLFLRWGSPSPTLLHTQSQSAAAEAVSQPVTATQQPRTSVLSQLQLAAAVPQSQYHFRPTAAAQLLHPLSQPTPVAAAPPKPQPCTSVPSPLQLAAAAQHLSFSQSQ